MFCFEPCQNSNSVYIEASEVTVTLRRERVTTSIIFYSSRIMHEILSSIPYPCFVLNYVMTTVIFISKVSIRVLLQLESAGIWQGA